VSQSGIVAVRNSFERSDSIRLFQFRHFYNFPSDKTASSLHMKMNNMTLRQIKSDRSIKQYFEITGKLCECRSPPPLSRGYRYTVHTRYAQCKLLWHFYTVLRYT
jgi:hypothetical protein